MTGYCKNRTFRSVDGCCICRAKSSTSRFTESTKYEVHFEPVFFLKEPRSGDICNACVLIIKRYKTMTKKELQAKKEDDMATFGKEAMWSYMLDSRIGPGTKSVTKIKNRLKEMAAANTKGSGAEASTSSPPKNYLPNECKKKYIPKKPRKPVKRNNQALRKNPNPKKHMASSVRTTYTSALDMNYWKPLDICCGKIFVGQNQEVFVVQELFKPCRGNKCLRPGGAVSPSGDSESSYTGSSAQEDQPKET